MTTEEWFDGLTAELVARSPFRRSEYFKRFASGALTREEVWGRAATISRCARTAPGTSSSRPRFRDGRDH